MSISLDPSGEWLLDARRVDSPNQDSRNGGTIIDAIVIHGISLPPKQYGGPYIDQLFTNRLDASEHPYFADIVDLRVSAHILIDRAGQITQYVPFSARARHAGQSELQGRRDCNEFSIGIELEGCDDEPYADCQYQVLAEVVRVLRGGWPDITRDRIVGHADVAPGRKTDPGPVFDWDYFFSLI